MVIFCLLPVLLLLVQMQGIKLDLPFLSLQVQDGARVTDGFQTADTVGTLVWAKNPDAGGIWWPAEALDPFFMPFTHELPPAAALSKFINAANIAEHPC